MDTAYYGFLTKSIVGDTSAFVLAKQPGIFRETKGYL
jgi:hypothetical protein